MRPYLPHILANLRASLWFVPTLLSVAGVALAVAAVWIDRTLPAPASGPWAEVMGGGVVGARNLLSTIAGGMITVTGVVFSITIVTLALASNQFGPRLLRSFMRDRGNQFVLGTFIGTFLYGLVALMNLGSADEATIPRTVLLVALLLTFTSVGVLIYFIHHISVSVQAESVVATVGEELIHGIDRLYPERLGEGAMASGGDANDIDWAKEGRRIHAERTGYLQAVHETELMGVSEENDLVVRLLLRPGHHVFPDSSVFEVWPPERGTEDVAKALLGTLSIGRQRTEEQDVEFALDQLVEVAVRALSPGTNDPFTAVSCLDRIGSALCRLGTREIPSPYRLKEGRLRLVAERSSYEGIVDSAFDQIRQYGKASVAVTVRLLEVVAAAARCTPDVQRRHVLKRHADRMLRDARRQDHDVDDMADIAGAYGRAIDVLEIDQGSGLDAAGPEGEDPRLAPAFGRVA